MNRSVCGVPPVSVGDRDLVAAGFELEKRAGRDKAIAADTLAADHALEQARAAAGVDAPQRRHGRQHVAKQATIDRHQMHPRREATERLEIGVVSHPEFLVVEGALRGLGHAFTANFGRRNAAASRHGQ